jgi:SAM-dependent methyltransferase/FKBP-type peptidyl-prolyl cis-trans isomerase 2
MRTKGSEKVNSKRINSDSVVDVVFHLKWKSDTAIHTDVYQASRINIWRDFLPPLLVSKLNGKQAGDRIEIHLKSDDSLPVFDERNRFQIKSNQFDRRFAMDAISEPGVGRFYPRGMLKNVAGVFKANVQPFRCVQLNNGHMQVDFNHPLSGKDLVLSGLVGKVETKESERGGSSVDWMEAITTGPGMQARWQRHPTDFFGAGAFDRDDESPDCLFYEKPRYVQHIDDTAVEMVKNTYGRFLNEDMQVLDLMSSWKSHIPDKLDLKRLVGIGLNENELKKNPRLSDSVVQDLNTNSILPFESDSLDAVICTVSFEYLIDPLAVVKEVSRVLRKDGYFIVTLSNRWFPTKAIRIWKELHDFERMGMVLECFIRSDGFQSLQTYSIRGLPRPHDDKYFPDLRYSDPIYAVWGQKA